MGVLGARDEAVCMRRDDRFQAVGSTPAVPTPPEIAMQFFSSTLSGFRSSAQGKGSDNADSAPKRLMHYAARHNPLTCGWYDSSFELQDGLEVTEQHDDDLYQLWQLADNR
jgi:hypothetical protein